MKTSPVQWIPVLTLILIGAAALFSQQSYLSNFENVASKGLIRLRSPLGVVNISASTNSSGNDEENGAVGDEQKADKVRRANSNKRSTYPEFCSKREQIEQRAIPPIGNETVSTQILQVFSVYRHGARTPAKADMCWENYDTLSEGFKWDCELQSLISPSIGAHHQGRLFAFASRYDALKPPLKNRKYDGTCQPGKLTDDAYDQMFETGRIMRDAYITTDTKEMKLFESAQYEDLPYERSSYFRSLENDMAMESGHMFVSGVFEIPDGAIVDIHTVSREVDPLEAKETMCPNMITARNKARRTKEYMYGMASPISQKLTYLVEKILKPPKKDVGMIDCLLTTYCTDRELPAVIDDFVSDDDSSIFNSLLRWNTWKATHYLTYNDGEYSKLATGPFWEEIFEVLNTTKNAKTLDDLQALDQPRFFLFSSNNFMMIPVLVSLGYDIWDRMMVPYASNVIIEHHVITSGPHEDFPSEHAFRLVWDGDVVTDRMDGCDADLCDLGILLDQLEPLLNRDCGTTVSG